MLAEMAPPELYARATLVVSGVVERSDAPVLVAAVGEDPGMPLLLTPHGVRVEAVHKDAVGALLPFRRVHRDAKLAVYLLGGSTETLTMHVNSEATLTPGERVIVFLSRGFTTPVLSPQPPLSYGVLGGFQGKFTIVDSNGSTLVTRGDAWGRMPLTEFTRRFLGEDETGPPVPVATA